MLFVVFVAVKHSCETYILEFKYAVCLFYDVFAHILSVYF